MDTVLSNKREIPGWTADDVTWQYMKHWSHSKVKAPKKAILQFFFSKGHVFSTSRNECCRKNVYIFLFWQSPVNHQLPVHASSAVILKLPKTTTACEQERWQERSINYTSVITPPKKQRQLLILNALKSDHSIFNAIELECIIHKKVTWYNTTISQNTKSQSLIQYVRLILKSLAA